MQDRWANRDLPVLLAAARLLEDTDDAPGFGEIAATTGLDEADVVRALTALDGVYLRAIRSDTFSGLDDFDVEALTERGRRAVGLWPTGDGPDALVSALQQAAEATSDEEEKKLLRRAGGAVASISRDVMSDVLAAVIKAQTGL